MRMPPSPASADERTNANTTMRGTLIPITAAALRLNATAISALPSSERRRNICTAKTVPSAATMMNSSCGKMPAEPIWRTASPNGEGNLICSGPHRFTAAFLRMMLTATVLSTQLRESRSEEHTSELQSLAYLVCRLLLEKKKQKKKRVNQYKNKKTKII